MAQRPDWPLGFKSIEVPQATGRIGCLGTLVPWFQGRHGSLALRVPGCHAPLMTRSAWCHGPSSSIRPTCRCCLDFKGTEGMRSPWFLGTWGPWSIGPLGTEATGDDERPWGLASLDRMATGSSRGLGFMGTKVSTEPWFQGLKGPCLPCSQRRQVIKRPRLRVDRAALPSCRPRSLGPMAGLVSRDHDRWAAWASLKPCWPEDQGVLMVMDRVVMGTKVPRWMDDLGRLETERPCRTINQGVVRTKVPKEPSHHAKHGASGSRRRERNAAAVAEGMERAGG